MNDKETLSVGKVRNPCGRPRLFQEPADLWNDFMEYCKWIDDNPWQEKTGSNNLCERDGSKSNQMRQTVQVSQRAYTLYGFCVFAGIHYQWADFKRNYIDKEGFSEVIRAIENTVIAQQLDGAMLNKFNANLVARLNGIADMKNVSAEVEVTALPKLTEEDLKKIAKINGSL